MPSFLKLSQLMIIPILFSLSSLAQAEECAEKREQLSNLTQVSGVLENFQSIDSILGHWKLGGVAGTFYKLKIALVENNSEFFVQSNEDELKKVLLCANAEQPGILKIKVLQPRTPENGTFLVKPTGSNKSLSIAAHGSKWKYMGFNRIQ